MNQLNVYLVILCVAPPSGQFGQVTSDIWSLHHKTSTKSVEISPNLSNDPYPRFIGGAQLCEENEKSRFGHWN